MLSDKAQARLVEMRVAWAKASETLRTREDPRLRRRVPDLAIVGAAGLLRRERYALRRLARQLKSDSPQWNGHKLIGAGVQNDRQILHLDPELAKSMLEKGLVESIEGRKPEHMFFVKNGCVVYLNQNDRTEHYHVHVVLTEKAKQLMDALLRMDGD